MGTWHYNVTLGSRCTQPPGSLWIHRPPHTRFHQPNDSLPLIPGRPGFLVYSLLTGFFFANYFAHKLLLTSVKGLQRAKTRRRLFSPDIKMQEVHVVAILSIKPSLSNTRYILSHLHRLWNLCKFNACSKIMSAQKYPMTFAIPTERIGMSSRQNPFSVPVWWQNI